MARGSSFGRGDLHRRLGNDGEARQLLFEWSMAEFVERYLADERLQIAYLGQGVIGTNASPFDPGTASIRFHHSSGRLGGMPAAWGFVKGGIGMVSFLLCDVAREAGAVVAAGVPVAESSRAKECGWKAENGCERVALSPTPTRASPSAAGRECE